MSWWKSDRKNMVILGSVVLILDWIQTSDHSALSIEIISRTDAIKLNLHLKSHFGKSYFVKTCVETKLQKLMVT